MNKNVICVYDFETGGKFPHKSQPTSLSCVMIDPLRLEFITGGDFDSLIRPILDDKEAERLGLEPLQDDALKITNLTREQLRDAPGEEEVFNRFTEHLKKFRDGTGKWGNVIPAGYNIVNFDSIFINRLAKKYGPWDDEYQKEALFHPIHTIDIMHIMFSIFENEKGVYSISFDNMRKFFGLSKDGAHSSIVDVRQCGSVWIKYQKWFRTSMKNMIPKMRDSMSKLNIGDFYDNKIVL